MYFCRRRFTSLLHLPFQIYTNLNCGGPNIFTKQQHPHSYYLFYVPLEQKGREAIAIFEKHSIIKKLTNETLRLIKLFEKEKKTILLDIHDKKLPLIIEQPHKI